MEARRCTYLSADISSTLKTCEQKSEDVLTCWCSSNSSTSQKMYLPVCWCSVNCQDMANRSRKMSLPADVLQTAAQARRCTHLSVDVLDVLGALILLQNMHEQCNPSAGAECSAHHAICGQAAYKSQCAPAQVLLAGDLDSCWVGVWKRTVQTGH